MLLVLVPVTALAEDIIYKPSIPTDGYPVQAIVTCYAPGAGGAIEGDFATSKPSLVLSSGGNPMELMKEGPRIPRTLDDVRLGKSQYVTLASNQINNGKWYLIGTVTYTSVIDNKQYTLQNVVGYSHDTGSAFNSSGCMKYGTCSVMTRKFDIAYGDFRGGQSDKIIYKSPTCLQKNQTWKQIGGAITSATTVLDTQTYTRGPTTVNGISPFDPRSYEYYCLKSAYPVIVVPTGSVPASQCLNSPYQQSAMYPQSSGQTTQSAGTVSSQTNTSKATSVTGLSASSSIATTTPSAVAALIAQPTIVSRGSYITLSWSSMGMRTDVPCSVSMFTSTTAQANEGSKKILVTAMMPSPVTFSLSCTSNAGVLVQRTASVTIR